MKNIIEIKNLTKYYGKILGVKDLNISIKSGEVFGFIGPNGAGKSTTIRCILNLINKTDGSVKLFGEVFNKDRIDLKKQIGYLPSEINLYEDLTIKEMLDYHESFYDNNLSDRRKKLVDKFKLDESKLISDLSFGTLKKVGIVLTFIHNPKIVILDEPTSGLDPIMQNIFYDFILEEKNKGTTIFYSTHILSEITKVCDRVGIIKDGKLLKLESIKELIDKNLTYITISSEDIDSIVKELKLDVVSREDNSVLLKNTLDINKVISVLNKYKINKLLINEASIEDIFMYYYK